MDGGDWRSQLQPESRQKIVNKITETLKRHLPFSGEEGLQELRNIAIRFEEKIYSAATSQSDYLRKISLKMLTMESKSQNTLPLPCTSGGGGGGGGGGVGIGYRTEIEIMADQIEEKMCSEAMNQQDYIQKLDNVKHAIDEAIMTQHTA